VIKKIKVCAFVFFGIGGMVGFAAFVCWSLWHATHNLSLPEFKRWFYTVSFMLICFYVVRAVRGLALWLEARANQTKEEL